MQEDSTIKQGLPTIFSLPSVVVMIWIIVLSFTGKYCERTAPEPIKASAQSLYIMFHSDELGTLKGFKAEWSSNKIGVKSGAKGKLYMIDKSLEGNRLDP